MRRNLTLEETGVLDLRKFLNSDRATKLWNENRHIIIPVDWLVAQGYDHVEANWDDERPIDWLRMRFSQIIISQPGYPNTIMYGLKGMSSYVWIGDDLFDIIIDDISPNGLVLGYEAI